ncbi:DUF1642 domain-containing protein [Enterococcus faecium]|uniref:DUF1642 domain-containing protein n=1 Tax=Enterococcus TaxID=1350 RepID=UPI00209174B2|nr:MULTISPECIES: DUF1642 domain-containing protein [Enterococcus]MCO5469038.1 DUF1642 domain-containing protein [Enterococcus faecium]MCO5486505.1 DUF1642 domain-containing protein [Enterococcus faecalis]
MNKQELIDKLAKYVKSYENAMDEHGQGRYGAYEVSLKLVKRLNESKITDEQAWNKVAEAYPESAQSLRNTLDNAVFGRAGEPQKPKTEVFNHDEKFVVEWLDHTTGYHYSLYNAINDAGSEVRSWMKIGFNSNRFARAFMSMDYEVEKEPLYTVTINLDRKYHLVVDEGDGNDEISTTLTTSHGLLGYRYFLTEKEIKSADENLWKFAVPVEEVVEG